MMLEVEPADFLLILGHDIRDVRQMPPPAGCHITAPIRVHLDLRDFTFWLRSSQQDKATAFGQ